MSNWSELNIINRTLEAAPLIPFACAWVRRHHIPYVLRPVYYFVGIKSVLYFLNILSRFAFRNDVYLYHLATVVLVVLLAQTYRRLLPERFNKHIILGVWAFAAVAVLDAVWLDGLFKDVNAYSQATGCTLLVLLAILHITHITSAVHEQPLEKQPEFFLSLAVLAYCSCSVVSYLALSIVYNMGYSTTTTIRLDRIITSPEMVLLATQMGLLAWMFCFFPLNVAPTQALPRWLHYSHWHLRPFRLLGQALSSKAGKLKPRQAPARLPH
ncbi:hypothetical protein HMJ29_13755 [Hymenobacter taeanensis]|uniref:Uncharacterized protein n=1 Tax=Hymenobacter taeanensis TaxID=2735321 RepID=A0A6M6BIK0_9BACT|nr:MULTISPECIES: hypothetical protein [Hymenobacter]QJX47946.1 hypothetical protein HMJ29_13755 [Hymenobacter taeanensis]UOQ82605.1 hypothetical protein MUN83_07545 [Hymenobacter sp. 5414T-23]